jgi:hypothetical protein
VCGSGAAAPLRLPTDGRTQPPWIFPSLPFPPSPPGIYTCDGPSVSGTVRGETWLGSLSRVVEMGVGRLVRAAGVGGAERCASVAVECGDLRLGSAGSGGRRRKPCTFSLKKLADLARTCVERLRTHFNQPEKEMERERSREFESQIGFHAAITLFSPKGVLSVMVTFGGNPPVATSSWCWPVAFWFCKEEAAPTFGMSPNVL